MPPQLAPLREHAPDAALFLDFDGTLAPIVPDPSTAVPAPRVAELLAALAQRLGRVAVVSGRPARYLADVLGRPPGVHLAGLYGMEEVDRHGEVREDHEAARWRPVVAEVAERLSSSAPPGADVEPKGLSVTLHWRRAPSTETWALRSARAEAVRTGLELQAGRMAVELRPPVHADKGTVVERLATGFKVVAFVGDDVGDLPAFDALDELAGLGTAVVRVAVADDESPPALAERADLVVRSTRDAVGLLDALAHSIAPRPEAAGSPGPGDGAAR